MLFKRKLELFFQFNCKHLTEQMFLSFHRELTKVLKRLYLSRYCQVNSTVIILEPVFSRHRNFYCYFSVLSCVFVLYNYPSSVSVGSVPINRNVSFLWLLMTQQKVFGTGKGVLAPSLARTSTSLFPLMNLIVS